MITKISKIKIVEINGEKGLVALASVLINDSYYIGSIGIYKALKGGYKGYRLTYPTKKVRDSSIKLFFPVNRASGNIMNRAIISEYIMIKKNSVK
jgi:DNA-binding cell septation regulator SpoVG